MKILSILLLLLFIIRKDAIILGSVTALNLWTNNLFPLLFPTFILSDFLLSSGIVDVISNKFGTLFSKIFKTSKYGLYIFLIGTLCGSPTNAKNIANLYNNKLISDSEVNKLLLFSSLFNPFLIITFGGIRCLLIFWIANIINSFLYRNIYQSNNISLNSIKRNNFNLSNSINSNINILLSILGTVTIFSCIIYSLSLNVNLKLLFSLLFELTNSINLIKVFFESNTYLYLIAYSLGGLSIFIQIKSILKDTFINYKLLLFNRCSLALISVILNFCFIT